MSTRTLLGIRTLGRLLAVLAAALWLVVLLAPPATATSRPAGVAAPHHHKGITTSCAAGATCATIPAHCPTGTRCPNVTVSPASNLGANQWVFLSFQDFPPGAPIDVYFCSNKSPIAVQDPLCMVSATPEILNPQVVLTASPSGTASISFETEENADDGNPALLGEEPGTQNKGGFFCDNAPNPCSIDVTDPLLHSSAYDLVLNPRNAVAVPITYQKATGGCPKATFVPTASEFGIDRLFPLAAQFDCVGKAPAIAVNFAKDSVSAVTAVLGGAYSVAFLDDPNAPDVQAVLAHLRSGDNPGYTLVPIALSSQVIAFKATMEDDVTGAFFPDNTFSLTPNMVAGLVTNYYAYILGGDVANCGKALGGACPLLATLNAVNGFRTAGEYGGFVRADTSSSTGELFDWICTAPKVPVHLGKQKVVETYTAAHVLVAGLRAGGDSRIRSCTHTDQFPSLSNTFAWVAASDPSIQNKSLSSFVVPPNDAITAVAGFAPMNASEANYYGLLPAALQNAAGRFVLPTVRSLDAATAIAIKEPNGTLSPNFLRKNPAAYPLPQFWYAMVPTAHLTAGNAATDRTLLTNLLHLSEGRQAVNLPPGFVPLPASLQRSAAADIAKIVPPVPASTTTTTTTLPPTTTTTTRPAVTTTTSPKVTATTHPKTTSSTVPRVTTTTRAFQTKAFTVTGRSDSWLAPAFVSAVAAAMIAGPALLLKTRRRPRNVA